MRDMGDEGASRFRQRFVGRKMMVLWEGKRRDGWWTGLTDNYLRVCGRGDDLYNHLTATRLLGVRDGHLVGEVIAE